jgi:phosphoglycolate/pyridoxal phosphate phosphatase family enzyme
MSPVRAYDAYVFDLDGTVYLGDELLPGAAELLAAIDRSGRRRVFLTNNPTRSREHYAAKLDRLGVRAEPHEVITSATITAAWIARHEPDAVCFLLGEQVLADALLAAGIRLSDRAEDVTLVVASYDRGLTYDKLRTAFTALWRRPQARLIATHPDAYCPLGPGLGEPDAAAVIAAVEASTGRTCEAVLGKPNPDALRTALDLVGVRPEQALMIGDRLATDIAMGRAAGTATALVLTGDSTREDVAGVAPDRRPTYVLDRIDALVAGLPDQALGGSVVTP